MTEAERMARATRAQAAMDEFLSPMFQELEAEYAERLIDIANTELDPNKRRDKVTALAHALKITRTLKAGMAEIIRDGDLAHAEKLKADKIEQMTKPQRRLLGIAPY